MESRITQTHIFDEFIDGIEDTHKKVAIIKWKAVIINKALFNLSFAPNKSCFTPNETQQLYKELSRIIYFYEGVPLFSEDASENTIEKNITLTDKEKQSKNLLKYLLNCASFSCELINWNTFKALVIEKDKEFLAGLRKAVQNIFLSIDLKNIQPHQEAQFAIQIADILAMYTFFDPFDSDPLTISIPQKVKKMENDEITEEWQLIEFNIHPIKLAYDDASKALFLKNGQDYDPNYAVYSYILEPRIASLPIEKTSVTPYLLFMGTPPPIGQGHAYAVRTDCEQGHSVGETMYEANKERIIATLDILKIKQVKVTGQSLGGALSLFFALDQPLRCKRADAFNPPGFTLATLFKKWAWDKLQISEKQDIVNIHVQQNDPVNKIGYWKEEWTLIKIFKDVVKPWGLIPKWLAHIRTFSNFQGSIALRLNTARENTQPYRATFTAFKEKYLAPLYFWIINKKINENNQKIDKENQHKSNFTG